MTTEVERWKAVHKARRWGQWPNTRFVEWVMRTWGHLPREDRQNVRFLELGCGAGAQLRFLEDEGFTFDGVDVSADAIRAAGELVPRHTLTVSDIRLYVPPHRVYSAVVDVCTLQHLPGDDVVATLVRARREWLQPGGRIFSMFAAHGSTIGDHGDVPPPRLLLESEIPHVFAGYDRTVGLETVRSPAGYERKHWIINGVVSHG